MQMMTMCCSIVGTDYKKATEFVNGLSDGEPVKLVREPTNPYDKNAVQVWIQDRQVGFVARNEAIGLSFKMDRLKVKTYEGTFRHFKGLSVDIEIEE